MVTREDHRLLADRLAADLLFLDLQMDEAGQDIQPRIPLPDFLPQVRRAVAVGVRWIAGPVVVTLIERQKERALAVQLRGHVDLVRIDGEVDQGPPLEVENGVPWVAIRHVLVHGMGYRLTGQRVLQFGRRHGDAIQGQHQIQRFCRLAFAVVQLPSDGQPVGGVQPGVVRVHAVGWGEEGRVDPLADALEAVTQHAQRARCAVQGLAQVIQDDRRGVRPVKVL